MSFELSEIVVKFQFVERFVVRNLAVRCTGVSLNFVALVTGSQMFKLKKKNGSQFLKGGYDNILLVDFPALCFLFSSV